MKLRFIIGAILAFAAAFRLLCLTGIIPLTFISSQWEAQWEPYFAAGVVLFVGAFICYDALKGMKK
jgi:putative Mn2+ efflux pump MntP